jgi:hypothetical protein
MYQEQGLEKLGGSLVGLWGLMFGIIKYGSPLITLYFYKKGYICQENLGNFLRISTGIGIMIFLSYFIRGYGRSQSSIYRKFAKELEEVR